MSNILKRSVVAVLTIPLVIVVSYYGGLWLFILCILICLLGMWEFLLNEKISEGSFGYWISMALLLVLLISIYQPSGLTLYLTLLIGVLSVTGLQLASLLIGKAIKKIPTPINSGDYRRLCAILYLGVLYPFIFFIREKINLSNFTFSNFDILLFLYLIVWVGDSAALFIGKTFGKHRLSIYQPTKTVEGSVGGLAGYVLIGFLAHWWWLPEISIWHLLIISLLAGGLGQVGDFFESYWKRKIGIKDSSKLLPGHGGILDRFDSLAFAGIVVFLYFQLFIL